MKVRELMGLLEKMDGDLPVVIATYADVGEASPISAATVDGYHAVYEWRGEVGPAKLTEKAIKMGYDKEDVIPKAKPAVVLWPKT